jgi:hypothetical protein
MDKIISTALSETDRLKELLYQSIKAPGLNPANTFLLLNSLLEREFAGEDTSEAFVSFVRSPRPEGLGMEPDDLLKVVMDLKHPHERIDDKLRIQMDEMRDRVRTLTLRNEPSLFDGPGRPTKEQQASIVRATNNTQSSDTATYALRRLKRDRPDLAEKVITGELSANAAAIEAGFRKPPSPLKQLRKAWDKASADERAEFLAEIMVREDRAA